MKRILLISLIALQMALPIAFADESKVVEGIKDNIIFSPLDENEVIFQDLLKAAAQTGMTVDSYSKSMQYLLKIEAAGEHLLDQKKSIQYAQVEFYLATTADKSRLYFKITPIALGIKDIPNSYDEIFIGVLPLQLEKNDFSGFQSAKVSLLGVNLKQTIPLNLATLVLKESINVLGQEVLKNPDLQGNTRRLEIFDAKIDARLKLNNLITLLGGFSQSIYLEDFMHIMSDWMATTSAYLGVELGLDVGDAILGVYAKGGVKRSNGQNQVYLEIGVNLADVLGLNKKDKKK